MDRILLVFAKNQEPLVLTSLLRAIGFDVLTLSDLQFLPRTLIEFHPRFILTEYSETQSIGLLLLKHLTKTQGLPYVYIFTDTVIIGEHEKVDEVLERPLVIDSFIQKLQERSLKRLETPSSRSYLAAQKVFFAEHERLSFPLFFISGDGFLTSGELEKRETGGKESSVIHKDYSKILADFKDPVD